MDLVEEPVAETTDLVETQAEVVESEVTSEVTESEMPIPEPVQ